MALPLAITWLTVPEARAIGRDWHILTEASQRALAELDPYAFTADGASFRWSPLVAYAFAAVAPLGPTVWAIGWAVALVAADRRVGLLVVTSLPFWLDVATGLSFSFLLVVAIFAIRGSVAGGLSWAALTVLIPRPLMLPLLVWLLWKQPRLRIPALAIMGAGLVGAVLTGWADSWVATLVGIADAGDQAFLVVSPARLLGVLWAPLAVAAAAWFTVSGHHGLAALAVSPYWLPGYYQIAYVEALPSRTLEGDATVADALVEGGNR